MIVYHESNVEVYKPKILVNCHYKDFGYGFYCTNIEKQAKRWDYVEDFTLGRISRSAFWELVKFRYPTHQIVFCTERSLSTLTYERSYSL